MRLCLSHGLERNERAFSSELESNEKVSRISAALLNLIHGLVKIARNAIKIQTVSLNLKKIDKLPENSRH